MRARRTLALAALLGLALGPRPAVAESAREILDRVRALDDTTRRWTDRKQIMTLAIHDAGGKERRRALEVYTKRAPGGEEKAISFFLAPPEVKGTAFLQWTHPGRDDEQWLYLPEFKRTRQISARLRDESFVGTDFSFRDLEILAEIARWSEADAATNLDGEESIDGAACWRIAFEPQGDDGPYRRIVLWLDQRDLVARKLDFFDREEAHQKSLALRDFRAVGPIPTAHRLEMRTLAKGSRTVVELPEVRYDTGLPDGLFTQRHLERGAP